MAFMKFVALIFITLFTPAAFAATCSAMYGVLSGEFCFRAPDNDPSRASILDRAVLAVFRLRQGGPLNTVQTVKDQLKVTDADIQAASVIAGDQPLSLPQFNQLRTALDFQLEDILRLEPARAAMSLSEIMSVGFPLYSAEEWRDMYQKALSRLRLLAFADQKTFSRHALAYLTLPHEINPPIRLNRMVMSSYFDTFDTEKFLSHLAQLSEKHHLWGHEVRLQIRDHLSSASLSVINRYFHIMETQAILEIFQTLRRMFGDEFILDWGRELVAWIMNYQPHQFERRTEVLPAIAQQIAPLLKNNPGVIKRYYQFIFKEHFQHLPNNISFALALAPTFKEAGILNAGDEGLLNEIRSFGLKSLIGETDYRRPNPVGWSVALKSARELPYEEVEEILFDSIKYSDGKLDAEGYSKQMSDLYDILLERSAKPSDFVFELLLRYLPSKSFISRDLISLEDKLFTDVLKVKSTAKGMDELYKTMGATHIALRPELVQRAYSLEKLFRGDFKKRAEYIDLVTTKVKSRILDSLRVYVTGETDQMLTEIMTIVGKHASSKKFADLIDVLNKDKNLRIPRDLGIYIRATAENLKKRQFGKVHYCEDIVAD